MTLRAGKLTQQRARRRRQAGFTLLELLVTLAILGLALVLIAGYRQPWSRGLDLRNTAGAIAAGLRVARSEAIVRNRPVRFLIDFNSRRFGSGPTPLGQLPPALQITLVTIAGEKRNDRVGGIRFDPDGSSTGGRIALADGRRTVAVMVDWLTGRVSIGDGP